VRDKNRGARDRLTDVAAAHGITPDRYVIVHGTLDAPRFALGQDAYDALAGAVSKVVHCAAMVNLAIGRQEMLDWSARGMQTVLTFCRDAQADLRFTSSSSVFPDRGGPWPEAPATVWEGCTGYGAAKIAAEEAIRAFLAGRAYAAGLDLSHDRRDRNRALPAGRDHGRAGTDLQPDGRSVHRAH